jgi:hypothetical protein
VRDDRKAQHQQPGDREIEEGDGEIDLEAAEGVAFDALRNRCQFVGGHSRTDRRGQRQHDELTRERGIDRAKRGLEHNEPEYLPFVQSERVAGLYLSLMNRLHAAADDLDGVGAAIDTEGDNGGGCGIELQSDERQGEEQKKDLHQERCIAHDLDEADHESSQPSRFRIACRDACDTDHHCERHSGKRQAQRTNAPPQQRGHGMPNHREIERVAHLAFPLGRCACRSPIGRVSPSQGCKSGEEDVWIR